ncbi:CatB-related O-acetyltransferase [Glutamicibacter bergerei]
MRIQISDLRPLLVQGRIFVAQGTKNIEQSGLGFPDDTEIRVQAGIRIEPYTTYWNKSAKNIVTMGAFSYTHSVLPFNFEVGRYTSIAKGLKSMGAKHPVDWVSTSPVFYNQQTLVAAYQQDQQADVAAQKFEASKGRVVIGNDVWIGENVTLGHDISIGDGAVIASNAVVTKDVEPFSVVGGVPARKIRDRFESHVIRSLQETRWWDYAPELVATCDVTSPEKFADSLHRKIQSGTVQPYRPVALGYSEFESALGSQETLLY